MFTCVFATAGFLIHGRRARIFGQIFDQIFGQVFDQGFWPGYFGQKIQCTVLPGRKNTVLPGRKKPREKPCNQKSLIVKNPILKT